jgi:hypothetical protein
MKILILIEADDRIEHRGMEKTIQTTLNHFSEDCTKIDVEGVDGVTRDSILQDVLGLSPTVTLATNPARCRWRTMRRCACRNCSTRPRRWTRWDRSCGSAIASLASWLTGTSR